MKKFLSKLVGLLIMLGVMLMVAIETLRESGAISKINSALSIVGFKINLPNIPSLNILSILPEPVISFLINSCNVVQNNIFIKIIILLLAMFLALELVCSFLLKGEY